MENFSDCLGIDVVETCVGAEEADVEVPGRAVGQSSARNHAAVTRFPEGLVESRQRHMARVTSDLEDEAIIETHFGSVCIVGERGADDGRRLKGKVLVVEDPFQGFAWKRGPASIDGLKQPEGFDEDDKVFFLAALVVGSRAWFAVGPAFIANG